MVIFCGNGKISATTLSGSGIYENIGMGLANLGAWQDVDQTGRAGHNWHGVSLGITLGSKTAVGGSCGTSTTTKPLYLIKEK